MLPTFDDTVVAGRAAVSPGVVPAIIELFAVSFEHREPGEAAEEFLTGNAPFKWGIWARPLGIGRARLRGMGIFPMPYHCLGVPEWGSVWARSFAGAVNFALPGTSSPCCCDEITSDPYGGSAYRRPWPAPRAQR